MSEYLDVLKKLLLERKREHDEIMAEIMKKIGPLEQQRAYLEKTIKDIEEVITDEQNRDMMEKTTNGTTGKTAGLKPLVSAKVGRFAGESPKKAYKEIIRTDLKDRSFKGGNVRNLAIKGGLKSKNDEPVSASYGRVLMSELEKEGFIIRKEKGIYIYNAELDEGEQTRGLLY